MLVRAAGSVYGFDQSARAWGRGGSLQVLSWISVPAAIAVGLLSALGFRVAGRAALVHPRLAGALVGFGAAALVVTWILVTPKEWEGSALLPLMGLCLAICGLAFAVGKLGVRRGDHAV